MFQITKNSMEERKPIVVYKMGCTAIGETKVRAIFDFGNLTIEVTYEEDFGEDTHKSLIFEGVHFFSKHSIPGVCGSCLKYEPYENIGDLIEYTDSDYARKWDEHFGYSASKHYCIFFDNENIGFDIIAESVALIEG